MRNISLWFAVVALCLNASMVHAQDNETHVDWLRDIDEARMVAAESNRDVFVLFTGRGWCQPCEMLDQLLFHDPNFVARLQELFVPVELDFNFSEDRSGKVRAARFQDLAKRYMVIGYPTMVFIDVEGKPFFVSQYPEGGPADFLARIEHAIAQKKKRDTYFAESRYAPNNERAQKLHAGILAVSELLTTIDDRRDDPVLIYYSAEVLSIMATPSGGEELTGIQEYYRKRFAKRDAWMQDNRLWEKINELRTAKQFDSGIEVLKRELEKGPAPDRKLSLEYSLIDFFDPLKKYDESISRIDSMLVDPKTDEQYHRRLWNRKVIVLYHNAGRKADAYTVLEDWIASSEPGSRSKLDAFYRKGMLLFIDKPNSVEAVTAWEAYRNSTDPDTFEYLTGTAYLARCELKSQNPARAAKLFDEIISILERERDGELAIRWPWVWDAASSSMLEAAEAHAAANHFKTASTLLARVEKEIEQKAQSNSENTKRVVDWLRKRLQETKQKIEKQTANNGNQK